MHHMQTGPVQILATCYKRFRKKCMLRTLLFTYFPQNFWLPNIAFFLLSNL